MQEQGAGKISPAASLMPAAIASEWLDAQPRSWPAIVERFVAAGRGLAAAHEAGLIHRDFKPDNVMLGDDGRVRVMDFGLARDDDHPVDEATTLELQTGPSPSASERLTLSGAVLGTPAYMAPEQLHGRRADAASDQFAFCVALWEGLFGERPFAGCTRAALAHAVTSGEIRAPTSGKAPPRLRQVLERGLRVEPEQRFASMTALLDAIARVSKPARSTERRLSITLALVAAASLALLGVSRLLPDDAGPGPDASHELVATDDPSPTEPVDDSRPRQLTTTGDAKRPTLSPDGEQLVYATWDNTLIHLDLRTQKSRPLEGIDPLFDFHFARDGTFSFNAIIDDVKAIYAVTSFDEAPRPIAQYSPYYCQFPARQLAVGFDRPRKNLTLHPLGVLPGDDAPEPEKLAVDGEYQWLSDIDCDPAHARVVLLHAFPPTYTLELISLDGGPQRVVVEENFTLSSPRFSASGDTLYYLAHRGRQTNLEALRLSDGGSSSSLPRVVLQDISVDANTDRFSLANNGRAAYSSSNTRFGLWRFPVGVTSLDGAQLLVGPSTDILGAALSPDGTRIAYTQSDEDQSRLATASFSTGPHAQERELTRAQYIRNAVWSPDGQTLAFIGRYRGELRVWTIPAAGGTATLHENTLASATAQLTWAPAEHIIYPSPGNRNYNMFDPQTEREWALIDDDSVGWTFNPMPSPDGKHVAVFWNREGYDQSVWTLNIDDHSETFVSTGDMRPISWSTDGRFIYQMEPGSTEIHRVPSTGGSPELWRALELPPRARMGCQVSPSEELLCAIAETRSDIWIVDDVG